MIKSATSVTLPFSSLTCCHLPPHTLPKILGVPWAFPAAMKPEVDLAVRRMARMGVPGET